MITILHGIKRMYSATLILQTESLICPTKVKETVYAPGDIRKHTGPASSKNQRGHLLMCLAVKY